MTQHTTITGQPARPLSGCSRGLRSRQCAAEIHDAVKEAEPKKSTTTR